VNKPDPQRTDRLLNRTIPLTVVSIVVAATTFGTANLLLSPAGRSLGVTTACLIAVSFGAFAILVRVVRKRLEVIVLHDRVFESNVRRAFTQACYMAASLDGELKRMLSDEQYERVGAGLDRLTSELASQLAESDEEIQRRDAWLN
jgi:hypothetical protein